MAARVDEDPELTTFVAQGDMTAEEILAALAHFLELGATRLTLWDLSRANLAALSPESIHVLARTMAHLGEGRRPAGKAAVVCERPLDFGMLRMLAAYLSIEGYPAEMQPFTTMEAAKAWLFSDVSK